jgi:MFS family permease
MVATTLATMGSAVLIPYRQGRFDDLGCTKLCLGGITSTRSALQLVGSPALGRFSDTHGRSAAFAVAVAGNCASLLLFAGTNSIWGIYIATIPQALLADRFGVMKAVVADMTPEAAAKMAPEEAAKDHGGNDAATGSAENTAVRAGVLGRLGAATGVGLMLGPMIGSRVLTDHYQAAALGIVANLGMLAAVSFLPVSPSVGSPMLAQPRKKQEPIACSEMPKTSEEIVEILAEQQQWLELARAECVAMLALLRGTSPAARLLLWVRFATSLAFHVYNGE